MMKVYISDNVLLIDFSEKIDMKSN